MNTKLIRNMPPAEYHPHPAWSHSQLKYLPGDPETFYGKYVREPKPLWALSQPPSRAMELGTAFHAMLLEGFDPPVPPDSILASNGAMTTKEAKAWKAEHPDFLKSDEAANLWYAVDRCEQDPEIFAYLQTEGDVELSMFWRDEATGFDCRGRLDKLCRFADGLEILDVKFSGGVDQRWVEKKIFEMGYYRQAAFYFDAITDAMEQPKAFTFLFAHSSPPYDAYLWRLNENDLDLGRRHNAVALADLRRRLDSNDWRTERFGKLNFASLPKWAYENDSLYAAAAFADDFSQFATFPTGD